MATGQFHLMQVISAFQDSKQPPRPGLSTSTLSVLLRADTLHPQQSQNKPQATRRSTGGRHPPSHAGPDKQSHSAHTYRGGCAGEAGAKSPAQHFWETAASGRRGRLQCSGRKEQHMDKLVAAFTCQRQGSGATDTSDLGSGQGQQ